VLPAAVMRSAPFLAGVVVFVAESVGFRSPALFVCVGLDATTVAGVIVGFAPEDVVVLDWVMAN
jgi:hypothetical protein